MLSIVLVASVPTACTRDPFAPPDPTPLTPPPSFAGHWAHMEACSGITGDPGRIQWFTVPQPLTTPDGRAGLLGVWVGPHTIYLYAGDAMDSTSWIVPHEMLHNLLQRGDHPPVFQTCGVG